MVYRYMPGAAGSLPRPHPAGTAGNASSLSYNSSAGIAGNTIYCPSSQAVPPVTKTAVNTRAPPAELNPQALERTLAQEHAGPFQTMYRTQYSDRDLLQVDFSTDPRREGAWRQRAAEAAGGALQPKPFLGRSEYQAATGSTGDHSRSAPPPPVALPPAVPKPGYLTTAAAASLPVQEAFADAAAATAAPAVVRGTSTSAASSTQAGSLAGAPCTVLSRFDGATTHQQGFGGRLTEELNAGTAKTSHHIPGFCGHIPASPDLAAAAGAAPRLPRHAAELYQLGQHSHGRLPGYTGHSGAALDLRAPTTQTSSGAAAAQVLRGVALAAAAGAGAGSSPYKGIKNAAGQGGISAAGRSEGRTRMRIPRPARTNPYGAAYSS